MVLNFNDFQPQILLDLLINSYSETSEQRTLWDQYKFKWFVPHIEVVLFKRLQSHYIDRGVKIWDLVLSIVERYLIQCPFIGGSSLRGSTYFLVQHRKLVPCSYLVILSSFGPKTLSQLFCCFFYFFLVAAPQVQWNLSKWNLSKRTLR